MNTTRDLAQHILAKKCRSAEGEMYTIHEPPSTGNDAAIQSQSPLSPSEHILAKKCKESRSAEGEMYTIHEPPSTGNDAAIQSQSPLSPSEHILAKKCKESRSAEGEVYTIHEPPSTGNDAAIQSQNMLTLVFNEQDDMPLDENTITPIAQFVLEQEGCSTDELSVYFVSEKKISELHSVFFNDPSPTDCISFPMDGRNSAHYHILGELFICPLIAKNYVADHADITHDPYTELTLYLVHGLLHLLGYRDEEEEEQKKMYATQADYLEKLIRKKILLKPKKI